MSLRLRPYQEEAIDAFVRSPTPSRQLIVLPTGTGKTVTGLSVAKKLGGRTLWIAHREELISQPAKALRNVWPGRSYGIVKADRNEHRREMVFASIQTIARDDRLARLKGFDLVVIDEAHHAPAESYRKVIEHLSPDRLLGLTATPERADNTRLDRIFDGICYQLHMKQAIEAGYLVGVDIRQRPINVNLDDVGSRSGDFKPGELDIALMQAGIVDEVVKAYQEHATARKTIIFTISVKQAEEIAAKLNQLGHSSAAVSGETPLETRRKILENFKSGYLKCVSNCMVLTEGFDEPSADCIIMARPTKSKSLYIQCVGRGLRLSPMKDECRIVDMVGLASKHTLVQAPVIFGLDQELTSEEREKAESNNPMTAREFWRARLSSQACGLKPVTSSPLKWVRSGETAFVLSCGRYGTVKLAPEGGDWSVWVYGSRVGRSENFPLANGAVDLEFAQGIAEDYVRRCGASGFAEGGRWRSEPPTAAQMKALRRFRIDIPDGLTRGIASDMLTSAAAKNFEPATEKQKRALRSMGFDVPDSLTKQQARRMFAQGRQR